jgi:branched-chain amino acid transport system permease protein
MEAAAQILTSGILIGAEYALAAVGMTLIFGVGRVLNLAHGAFFALGAYVTYEATRAGFPALIGAVPAAAAGFALGVVVERLFVRPVRGHMLTAAVVLLGLAIVAEQAFAFVWGAAYHSVPLSLTPLMIHRVVASAEQIIDAGAAVAALGALGLFLRTRPGLALRTSAADPEIAALSGINVADVQTVTFGAACAMASAAGAFLSPLLVLSPTMGRTPLVLALAMVIVGGPGSVGGTLAASLGVGLASTIVAYYLTGAWSYVLALVLIIGVVAGRPSSLWSERGR